MKQYEEYKDSGIQWIGKIPKDWCLLPLKYYISFAKGRIPKDTTDENVGFPYLTMDYLRGRKDKQIIYTKDTENLPLMEDNDIIVLWDGANAGEFMRAKKGYLGSTMAKVSFNQKKYDGSYFFYLLCSIETISKEFANGTTIPHFDSKILTDYSYPCPDITEQQSIASYLDYKVGQIDIVISEKEKMLEDLKAYRSAIISETITNGLGSDVEMKDSGVQWIGMIPNDWNCLPLKYLLSETLQYGANEPAEYDNPEWPRYIRITDIDDSGKLKQETFKSLPPEKAQEYILKKGDVLFARSGATVGKTYIFEEDYKACFAGYLIKASCNEKLLPQFLYLYTNSKQYENWKNSVFTQATIQNIGADKYSLLPIAIPPSRKQQQIIIDFINKKLINIDAALDELRAEVEDLKSYKSSLITEAVTGKIDLRDWEK